MPYNLRNCAYIEEFDKEKIVYNDITQYLSFALLEKGYYFNNTVYFIAFSKYNKYFISILNSKLINYYYRTISQQLGQKAVRMFSIFVQNIPIPKIDKKEQKKFTELADTIINAIEKRKNEISDSKIDIYDRMIETKSREIDKLVYELYGLTDEEIAYIEKNAG